jgi:hypothetical protein
MKTIFTEGKSKLIHVSRRELDPARDSNLGRNTGKLNVQQHFSRLKLTIIRKNHCNPNFNLSSQLQPYLQLEIILVAILLATKNISVVSKKTQLQLENMISVTNPLAKSISLKISVVTEKFPSCNLICN